MSDQEVIKNVSDAFPLESKSTSPIEIDKTLLENIIGTVSQPEHLTEPLGTIDDHITTEKTSEVDNSDQTNSKKSRELKLLLALSKEANLDTNISHKRNSLEGNKTKDKEPSKVRNSLDAELKKTKVAHENRNIRYPVTAESELELDASENDKRNLGDNPNKILSKRKRESLNEVSAGGATGELNKKNKKLLSSDMARFKPNKDMFCWRCHREGVNIACETCPRSYHQKCLKQTINDTEHWPCPECVSILKAESTQTRSFAMKGMTLEHLCSLLKFAVNRMIQCQGSEPFLHPVNDSEFPDYKRYIVQPMDLTKIEKNIKGNLYGSTQAFEADAKWLLHNSIIFNSYQSKLTSSAKSIIKICKQEMAEIENCPSCYLNANTKKDTWFVEVCPKPHLLVWAKLKGFPFWPAKAMCTNPSGMVDVRFFGAHDRAWVHFKECYLFCEKDPNTFKQKRYDIEKCIAELNIYIENLKKVYGEFRYAPYKTILDPENEVKQLQIFLPKYNSVHPKKKILDKTDGNNTTASTSEDREQKEQEGKKEDIEDNKDSSAEKIENDTENKNELTPENIPETDKNKKLKDNNDLSDINHNGTDLDVNGKPLSDASSSLNKFNDDIMEGYGTDDDSNVEIDLERRKRFIERNSIKGNEKTDEITHEDEEDDTQVPSNISVDKSCVEGSDKNTENDSVPGKVNILERRTSEPKYNPKRQSCEDVVQSLPKLPRLNSDENINSEPDLIPTISEKINIVDIAENMEITLGNDDTGCISISENISSNSSDSEMSKLGSESGKRKPIQVDIENTELTISPTSKLKMSDKLIKRLSDANKSETPNSEVEEVKKNILEKKSPTDILIEKFKNVVDHEVVDFSEPSTSTGDNENSTNPNITDSTDKIEENNAITSVLTVEENTLSLNKKETIEAANVEFEDIPELINTQDKLSEEKNTKTSDLPTETPSTVPIENSLMCDESKESGSISEQSDKNKEKAKDKKDENPSQLESEELPNKQKVLIQPSITEFTVSSSSKLNESSKTNQGVENIKDINTSNNGDPKPMSNKEKSKEINVAEETEDGHEVDDIEIDKNKIFSIIHSSLNENKSKEAPKKTTSNIKTTSDSNLLSRKRKIDPSDNPPSHSKKMVKLVPIESIINPTNTEKKITDSPMLQKSLQGKKMIRKPSSSSSTPASSNSPQNSIQEITAQDIKSEPETDDDFSESENLEAKKKYLSALNISEKINDNDKGKGNSIRTRSKTEEKREKFKKLDNLTRIIDDVALNYNSDTKAQELSRQRIEMKKSTANSQEGEIFVKSFAKLTTYKPRARKSFPTPSYIKPNILPRSNNQASLLKKDPPPSVTAGKKDYPKISLNSSTSKIMLNNPVSMSQSQQTTTSTGGASVSLIILPPNQNLSYSSPMGNQVLTVVSPVVSTATTTANSTVAPITNTLLKPTSITPNVVASQNYIPQNEQSRSTNNTEVLHNPNTSTTTTTESDQAHATEATAPTQPTTEINQEDEFGVLNSLLPESVSRAVSDLLLRPPPRLKPRPPGPLSTVFDQGTPSSAGSVTAKINSVAHRLGDYFRGMLIETLEDLGKSSTPEATIASLQMEIETLKHHHSVEISEIRKNVCTILKDIQKSIVEDRDRIIDETRIACEAETIKRVELAKSKQWCANCSKEAQFYCCWNTSYCDYPCQQKHWPQHVGKCTQNIEKSNNTATPPNRPSGQQLILRPAAPPKPGMGRIVAKPTKVYMNRSGGTPKTFKQALSSTGNHLTVIETTPGNYELVGNGPIAVSGKLLATSSGIFHPKYMPANLVTVTSPSTSGNLQRININSELANPVTSVNNSSVANVRDDDSD